MATATHYDLLSEPLLTVDGPDGRASLSLPQVLARLGRGEDVEFPRLRPHQHHAWHALLVQLAALAAHRRGGRDVDLDEETWRRALLDLADEAGSTAWHLVVEDPALPAFLQTPAPEKTLAPYGKTFPTPDSLDVLVTTKNHDYKSPKMTSAAPEHWCYALASVQTMDGYIGRGNYGIARMNGGLSNRPCLTMTPGLGWAERFHRDVHTWLDARPDLVGEVYGYREHGGHELLWLLAWDGEKTFKLPVRECDPFFIEVCRRAHRNTYILLHDTNLYVREMIRHAGVKRWLKVVKRDSECFEVVDFPFSSGLALVRVQSARTVIRRQISAVRPQSRA